MKQVDTSILWNSHTAQGRSTRIGEQPDQTNKDNSTNYYDTPMYVVDV